MRSTLLMLCAVVLLSTPSVLHADSCSEVYCQQCPASECSCPDGTLINCSSYLSRPNACPPILEFAPAAASVSTEPAAEPAEEALEPLEDSEPKPAKDAIVEADG